VSTTFRRSLEKLGVKAPSPRYKAVSATMRVLASTDLPGNGDFETEFAPARAYVRRVSNQNLWLLYRFDDEHVFLMTIRDQPPTPIEP
jgi:hypothetical protein